MKFKVQGGRRRAWGARMNLWNHRKMKNKTTNVIFSFCLYCALLIYHTGRVLSSIIFIPFMDSLIQQLNERFSGKAKSAMCGIHLIPSLIEKFPESEIFEQYQSVVPSESSFSQEIQLWKQKQNWANEKNIPTTSTAQSTRVQQLQVQVQKERILLFDM